MRLWVDSDSCPRQIREILSRGALRFKAETFFVANRKIPFPGNDFTHGIIVPAKEGSADRYILSKAQKGDLVVTRDIPLAGELVDKDILVLNIKGEVYTRENIGERLSIRDFMKELRDSGLPAPEKDSFGDKEVRAFANAFDREFTKLSRQNFSTANG